MAQLWGGSFTKETDQLVYNFNASISFDQKFLKQDIEGSIAHATMLGKSGIIMAILLSSYYSLHTFPCYLIVTSENTFPVTPLCDMILIFIF